MSSKTLGKSKPISGRVKSESDTYLLNVHIESLPSKTTTKTDENGMFFFEIPIKDKRLSFDLNGFYPMWHTCESLGCQVFCKYNKAVCV